MKIDPVPFRASVRMVFRLETCISWFFNGLRIDASNSRADASSSVTCTVIWGISISGISDTGSSPMATEPSVSTAIRLIVTATGRSIKRRIIKSTVNYFLPTGKPSR